VARNEIAAALQPLGLGSPLQDPAIRYYVGLSIKGSGGQAIEVTHPDDAILGLEAGDERFQALLPGTGPALPLPLELYAGRVTGGIQNRLTIGDHVDLSRWAGVRVFALEPGDGPDYEAVEFSDISGAALSPFRLVSGTKSPLQAIAIVPAEGGTTELRGNDGRVLASSDAGITTVVVGCRDRRIKSAQSFAVDPEADDPRRLDRLLRAVVPGDWVAILAPRSSLGGAESSFGPVLEAIGLSPSGGWNEVRDSLVAIFRSGAEPLRYGRYMDPDATITVELTCDPQ